MNVTLLFGIKFSICIAILEIFYKLILIKLTFIYNSIRWYFIFGLLLSLVFSTISFYAPIGKISTNRIIEKVPNVHILKGNTNPMGYWRYSLLTIGWIGGMFIFLLRLAFQFIAFFKMKVNSIRVQNCSLPVFTSEKLISPFSFVDSLFINPKKLEKHDYESIIAHE